MISSCTQLPVRRFHIFQLIGPLLSYLFPSMNRFLVFRSFITSSLLFLVFLTTLPTLSHFRSYIKKQPPQSLLRKKLFLRRVVYDGSDQNFQDNDQHFFSKSISSPLFSVKSLTTNKKMISKLSKVLHHH